MAATIHRRAQIINALAELFEVLKEPVETSGLPIEVKTVQKRFIHWTALDRQDALPAILLNYGDNGSVRDSDVVGYVEELFPIAVTAVMKEDVGLKDLTEQVSDMHYALGQLINSDQTLGVEGVIPDRTRIAGWRSSEGDLSKYEVIRFRVQVVHRYHSTENV